MYTARTTVTYPTVLIGISAVHVWLPVKVPVTSLTTTAPPGSASGGSSPVTTTVSVSTIDPSGGCNDMPPRSHAASPNRTAKTAAMRLNGPPSDRRAGAVPERSADLTL